MNLTPALQDFVRYFGEMGPRWGLSAATCRMHALLYIADGPLPLAQAAAALDMPEAQAAKTLDDLRQWGMAHETPAGWDARRDPWDMMLTALQQRMAREMQPAIATIAACRDSAKEDDATPASAVRRLDDLAGMFHDLAAISRQTARLSPAGLARLIRFGGRASRFAGRF